MTTTSLKWGTETVINKQREGKKVNIWGKLGPSCTETTREHKTCDQEQKLRFCLFATWAKKRMSVVFFQNFV